MQAVQMAIAVGFAVEVVVVNMRCVAVAAHRRIVAVAAHRRIVAGLGVAHRRLVLVVYSLA